MQKLVRRLRRRRLVVFLLGIGLVCVGLISWFWVPRPSVHRLRVTGGIEGLNRHAVAAYLRRHARKVGIEIEVCPTEGTVGRWLPRSIRFLPVAPNIAFHGVLRAVSVVGHAGQGLGSR